MRTPTQRNGVQTTQLVRDSVGTETQMCVTTTPGDPCDTSSGVAQAGSFFPNGTVRGIADPTLTVPAEGCLQGWTVNSSPRPPVLDQPRPPPSLPHHTCQLLSACLPPTNPITAYLPLTSNQPGERLCIHLFIHSAILKGHRTWPW